MTEETEQPSTDSEQELYAVMDLDFVSEDEEARINLLCGDTWLPYQRVAALVSHKCIPLPEETSRPTTYMSPDFNVALMGHEDTVVIYGQPYSGFDLKCLLYQEDIVDLLLGEEAIRPHVCPKPQPKPAEPAQELNFWETGWASTLAIVTFLTAGFAHIIIFSTLVHMLSSVNTRMWLVAIISVGSLMASGGLTLICGKLRDKKVQDDAYFVWAMTLWSCLWAGFGVLAALGLCFKLA